MTLRGHACPGCWEGGGTQLRATVMVQVTASGGRAGMMSGGSEKPQILGTFSEEHPQDGLTDGWACRRQRSSKKPPGLRV